MSKPIFILGGYQTDFARAWSREGLDFSDMMKEAAEGALADARIPTSAVQTIHVGNAMGEVYRGQAHMGPIVAQVVPEFRGLPSSRHEGACASSSLATLAAAAELEAGRYECALVLGVEEEKNVPGERGAEIQEVASWVGREDVACRYLWPAVFGRITHEYAERDNLDRRHLNRIAQINRTNARQNPRAQTRKWTYDERAFTDNELNPEVEVGTRRLDCTHISDGACAIILANEEFAAEHAKRLGVPLSDIPRILGWGHRGDGIRFLDKLERTRGERFLLPHVRGTITDAWRRAGIQGIEDLDGVETHDCFSATEYMAIDHFGVAPAGQAWRAIEEGTIERKGSLPFNASGGLIGIGHPVGATGARMIFDAAKQVTGRAEGCQIEGARTMQTLNIGGSCATITSFVIGAGE
jgi:acetyl-CoA C-acetyltransferase